MQIGVLDFGESTHTEPSRVLGLSLKLAKRADELGYSRYWLTEHHAMRCAWGSPIVPVTAIASMTNRIRVGCAGLLICLYPPIDAAGWFAMLSTLFPGRIDCGISGGRVADVRMRHYPVPRNSDTVPVSVDAKIEQLCKIVSRAPCQELRTDSAFPVDHPLPDVWLMGTSGGKRILAAQHGLGFSYTLLHKASRRDPDEIERYFGDFVPSDFNAAPKANVAINVACDETRDKAITIAQCGSSNALHDPIVGSPLECIDQIMAIADKFHVSEVILKFVNSDLESIQRSFELIAESAKRGGIFPRAAS